jgi:aspartyl/asparaginyl beta-hydroxylase (cupin superfamily)
VGDETIIAPGRNVSLIAQADQAMARGNVREAASLLEVASQRASDANVLLRLATVRRSLNDIPGAVNAAAAGVELSPRNFLLCLLLGSLLETMGAIHRAQRAYRAACAVVPRDLSFQPAMRKQLEWAQRRVEAADRWRQRVLEWDASESAAPFNPQEERRIRGFRTNLIEGMDSGPTAAPVFMVPAIKAKRFFDPSDFAGVAAIERQTAAIRDEFLVLAEKKKAEISSRLAGLHAGESETGRPGSWSMIPLMRNGRVIEEFASMCPRTMELAKGLDLPKLGLISPSLYFSVLEPNSRIAPHKGITNARLIAHFPLIVPNNCGFRVGSETRRWEPGKALIFDDMTNHEAWNDSDRIRVVLIADLWRPELTEWERATVTALMDCPDIREEP